MVSFVFYESTPGFVFFRFVLWPLRYGHIIIPTARQAALYFLLRAAVGRRNWHLNFSRTFDNIKRNSKRMKTMTRRLLIHQRKKNGHPWQRWRTHLFSWTNIFEFILFIFYINTELDLRLFFFFFKFQRFHRDETDSIRCCVAPPYSSRKNGSFWRTLSNIFFACLFWLFLSVCTFIFSCLRVSCDLIIIIY